MSAKCLWTEAFLFVILDLDVHTSLAWHSVVGPLSPFRRPDADNVPAPLPSDLEDRTYSDTLPDLIQITDETMTYFEVDVTA